MYFGITQNGNMQNMVGVFFSRGFSVIFAAFSLQSSYLFHIMLDIATQNK